MMDAKVKACRPAHAPRSDRMAQRPQPVHGKTEKWALASEPAGRCLRRM